MSATHPSLPKSVGLLAFLVTAVIGWNFAVPDIQPLAKENAAGPATKRATRPLRAPRSAAADAAGSRMGSIRTAADGQARMLATIALANSLSPAEFAVWMDRGWFDLRGGPELMLFSKILRERWKQEEPEGFLAWSINNPNDAAQGLMDDWAAKDPRRLIDFFKSHRSDGMELKALSKIAASFPDLALQRLREMVAAGIAPDAMSYSPELFGTLARTSSAKLGEILDSLPPRMKIDAEAVLSGIRLDASFSEEIRNLWDRPDGWKIFSRCASDRDGIVAKLLGELANLPPEWRAAVGANSSNLITASSARQWWDADLEGAGFSASVIKTIRIEALTRMTGPDSETAILHLDELDLNPARRKFALNKLFTSGGDPEQMRRLIEQLPNEEERQTATRLLDQQVKPADDHKVTTPDDLLAKLGEIDPAPGNVRSYFSQMMNWDPEKISAFADGFTTLPDDRKQQVALAIAGTVDHIGVPPALQGDAIRYLVDNPPAAEAKNKGWSSLAATSSNYAVQLSRKDPVAASEWVEALGDGEAKLWARKNLAANWVQYDPEAVDQWLTTLPADVREEVTKHMRKKR